MRNDNVIEFNGKRYDATTGKLLGTSHAEVVEPLAAPRITPRAIDGVIHKKSQFEARTSTHAPVHSPARVPSGKPTPVPLRAHPKSVHHHAPALKPHRPQAAKTLMRRAVHKPQATIKPAIKPQAPAEVMARPVSAIAAKHSVHQINPERNHRASHTPKSQAVQRFITPAPEPHVHILKPAHVVQPTQHIVRPQTIQRPKPDIFEAAIASATSHQEPPVRHKRKHSRGHRVTGMLAGISAFLLLAGFVTYLNLATIELKVASFNAGFSAHLPSYKPTGYELADIKDKPGQITLSFRSGDRTYQLSQQPTNWNSQTLQDNIIASASHKTIESQGRTIYLYDGIASWVSGGVRYDITGNANFDAQEVAAIAASM